MKTPPLARSLRPLSSRGGCHKFSLPVGMRGAARSGAGKVKAGDIKWRRQPGVRVLQKRSQSRTSQS